MVLSTLWIGRHSERCCSPRGMPNRAARSHGGRQPHAVDAPRGAGTGVLSRRHSANMAFHISLSVVQPTRGSPVSLSLGFGPTCRSIALVSSHDQWRAESRARTRYRSRNTNRNKYKRFVDRSACSVVRVRLPDDSYSAYGPPPESSGARDLRNRGPASPQTHIGRQRVLSRARRQALRTAA